MIAQHIEGATRVLNAPPDWTGDTKCGALAIRDSEIGGEPFMVSAWAPTPAEISALNRGESVKLWIRGNVHPAVALSVG